MVGSGRKNANPKKGSLNDNNTQPVDTQNSPESFPGDGHEVYHDQYMGPADDHLFFNDAFETQLENLCAENKILDIYGDTQVVDFGGETQVVDFGGETQVVDFGGETQLVDDHDDIQDKHIEVAADTYSEGSDRTEVLCDTEELSDGDSIKHSSSSIDQVKLSKRSSNPNTGNRNSIAQSDVLNNDKHHSGSLQCGFTSIRAASLRASGLAARDIRHRETKESTWSIKSGNPLEQGTAGQNGSTVIVPQSEVRKELNTGVSEYDEQMKEVDNEKRCKVGSSAARKLFEDEILIETTDLPQTFNDGMAGLSYLDSQEPGEESQANALEVVDKFLELNPFDFDQDIDVGKSSMGKSKLVSAVKGTKSLAQTSATRITDLEGGIFDWDDDREDEGGGEFFQKTKDLFTDRRAGAATEPRKRGSHNPVRRGVKDCREKEKHPLSNKKLKGSPRSDSRLMSRKGRAKKEPSKLRTRKTFVQKLDEQLNEGAGDGKVDVVNGPDMMLDVGLDTQMAAEAMQTLCFRVPGTENDHSNGKKGDKTSRGSSYISRADDESLLNQRSLNKKPQSSDTRPVTRLSRSTMQKDEKLVEEHLGERAKRLKSIKKQGDGDQGAVLKPIKPNMTNRGREEVLRQDERTPKPSTGSMSGKNCDLQEQHESLKPATHRTRQHKAEILPKSRVSAAATSGRSGTEADVCETLMDQGAFATDGNTDRKNMKSMWGDLCAVDHPKGRSHRKMASMGQETTTLSCRRSKRLRGDPTTTSTDVTTKKRKCSPESVKKLLQEGIEKGHPEGTSTNDYFVDEAPGAESSTGDQCKASASAHTTPTNSRILKNSVSPICMGDEYHKQSCRKSLSKTSLLREVISLHTTTMQIESTLKDSRKRREMTNLRVLFSQHLDADIIKQQKKILARLGASSASSMSDATHFVADEFVRTRNMLEAISVGKPVVTHLWLESCGQASCLIDEKNYILRDARKEKEFGFSMPVTLERACQHPLLQGYRAFITPNTKPGKEILASLVKAVHGLAVERLCRSAMKDEVILDDLLVLSCEEDYEVCIPFLEKGAAVYSSELLLNGIVTQRLEFDRYRLFTDHVKKTRSTVWVKKNDNQYLPVAKCK